MPRLDIKETTPQMLARLVHAGGKVLVVGGGTENLPTKYTNHPQLLFWDDNVQGHEHKEVPANVRVIMWTRWISHSTAGRLNEAVIRRRLLKFPLLRTGELKALLAEIVQEASMEIKNEQEVQVPQEAVRVVEFERQKSGTVRGFVRTNFNPNLKYSERGVISEEGKRLFELAQVNEIRTTYGSVVEALRVTLKKLGVATNRTSTTPRVKKPKGEIRQAGPAVSRPRSTSGNDDFDQLDKLIEDAITAFRLVQEQMSVVREETERWRGMREKMRALLE